MCLKDYLTVPHVPYGGNKEGARVPPIVLNRFNSFLKRGGERDNLGKDETPALKHLVKIFDKNGDGELSFKELFGRESEADMKKYSEEFKMADQNEDGKLDTEELFDLHNMVWHKYKEL